MKKRVLSILLAVFLIAATIPLTAIPASAETYSGNCGVHGDNLKWSLDTSTGVLDITGSGYMEDYLQSFPHAPWNDKKNFIKTVNIANGVTYIGRWAFYYCSSLESITIPDSVYSIGQDAFYECSSLEGVYITDLAKWCNIRFGGFSNPLYYAHNLYLNNQLVTDLVIPNGVTSIGDDAFYNCSSLASINIPDSVTTIGVFAFRDCSSLKGVYITDLAKWCNISFGNSVANPLSNGANLYLNNQLVTDLVIPNGVTKIKADAFYGCTSIKTVTIPDGVTTIGSSAFSRCNSLASINIPDSVTTIGSSAFSGCNKDLTFFVSYGSYAQQYAKDNSIKFVINGKINETVKWSFDYVTGTLTVSGKGAMVGYSSGASTPWNGLKDLIKSIVVEEGITSIGSSNFADCGSLENVSLPKGLLSIGKDAFLGCVSLESIVLPEGLMIIGEYAFSDCNGLSIISIPASVDSIGKYAFFNCIGLHGKVARIKIKSNPTKTQYAYGEALDVSGGKLAVETINMGENPIVSGEYSMTADMISGYNSKAPGKQTLTVTYNGTKAGTFEVEVASSNIIMIMAESMPAKTNYIIGQSIITDGGSLVCYYKDGTLKHIAVTPKMITGYDANRYGKQTVKIVYEDFECPYDVVVKPVVFGDIDANDVIDAADALIALQNSIEMCYLDGGAVTAADVDKNGKVDAIDALYTLQFSIGKIKEFPDHSK